MNDKQRKYKKQVLPDPYRLFKNNMFIAKMKIFI